MAGLTDSGFAIKRMTAILSDLRLEAVSLFQDLVEPGDQVDVSDSSALGRLISLTSPSNADLWEAAQQVYAAFDPNTATGIALDNLVAYAGLRRKEQTFTTAPVLVSGDANTLIPTGQTVGSSTTAEQFTVNSAIALTPTSASGITLSVLTITNTTAYTIDYSNGTTTNTINFTSDADASLQEILSGLQTVIVSAHPTLTSTITGTGTSAVLVVNRVDIFQRVSFSTSTNLGILKVRTIGEVVASNVGPIVQPINSINTILTPTLGWDSVTNPTPASVGENKETDEELRARFRNAKFDAATNTLDSIYSALVILDNVGEVVIYENDTSVVDSNGVPAHSFLPIVSGALSTDIAQAIWDNKPIGILSYGNTTVVVNDAQGFPHSISFSRPNPVVIYITINITTDSTFPSNGNDAIRSAIISYFDENMGIGDDVVYSRLYTPINQIPGFQVESLNVGTAPSATGTGNIVIPFNSIASISAININIT